MPVSRPPLVSILILNFNGREHLERCLPSVEQQDYARDRFHIEVIDNGSTDGSVDLVRERFPRVRMHRFDRNRGFAPAYDDIARRCSSEYIAFLNNDTRVESSWLSELVSAADRHRADCVAGRILDWDGAHVDFVGGVTSFVGHSWQPHIGDAPDAVPDRYKEERPLLFACGGSMLIKRDVYVDAGGFDRDFFAYFEDVDLGWRLNVLGYKTIFAPKAITYHRLHGTASRTAFAQRMRLYERNALAMLYKNYEDESLRRVLPAAVALSLARGLAHSGLDPSMFRLGAKPPEMTAISARMASFLFALEDFTRLLPALNRARADIQRRRKVSDAEVLKLFGDPFRLHEAGAYAETAWTLIRDLGIDELFPGSEVLGFRGSEVHPENPGTPEPRNPRTPEPQNPRTPEPQNLRTPEPPKVSVIVLTVLGATHLPDCLSSLRALNYPADRREIIVVDNASEEDPSAAVEAHYPGARVIRNPTNVGFAVGNNIGARAATGDYVVFLNDDTRVHPDWMRELVDTAIRRNAASVGSRIVTWDGSLIDFVGGVVNFEARGFQTDIGQPQAGRHTDECPLLFACGGSMLVKRDVFLEVGGWDEGAFAYYEDVELGWRLWLLGHEVWFAPNSIMFHKHHGTWGRWPEPPRLRLYERNSMRILYTHLERETLCRVFPAALLLAADRAFLATALSRVTRDPEEVEADRQRGLRWRPPPIRNLLANFKGALRQRGVNKRQSIAANLRQVGVRGLLGALRQAARASSAPPAPSIRAQYQIERGPSPLDLDSRGEPMPTRAAAGLAGVSDFLLELPGLSPRRARLQAARRRTDREILGRFGLHWTSPAVAPHQMVYEQFHRELVETLGIDEIIGG